MKAKSIDEKLNSALIAGGGVVKDSERLQKQQKYYEKLTKKGVIRKQTYSLKPLSAI